MKGRLFDKINNKVVPSGRYHFRKSKEYPGYVDFLNSLATGNRRAKNVSTFRDLRHNWIIEAHPVLFDVGNYVFVENSEEDNLMDAVKARVLCLSSSLRDDLYSNESILVNHNGIKVQSRVHFKYINQIFAARDYLLSIPPPSQGNFFDVRQDGLSYSTGIPEIGNEGRWKRDGRQVIRPSRLVKYLIDSIGLSIITNCIIGDKDLDKKIKQRFLEIKSESLKAFDRSSLQVSDSPHKIYNLDTSDKNNGTLGSSCMRPESEYGCKEYTHIFDEMGAKVLFYQKNNFLMGRALLWDNAKDPEGQTVKIMDRIYGSELCIEVFKKWAHENGYAHKENQNSESEKFISIDGDIGRHFTLSHTFDEDDGCPYMDSFTGYDYGTVTTAGEELQNCDGHPFDRQCCDSCGTTDDEVSYCEEDGTNLCDDCGVWTINDSFINQDNAVYIDGEGYVSRDDSNYISVEGGGTYHLHDVFYCDNCDEYHHVNDSEFIEELELDLCPNCDRDSIADDNGYSIIDGTWCELETKD